MTLSLSLFSFYSSEVYSQGQQQKAVRPLPGTLEPAWSTFARSGVCRRTVFMIFESEGAARFAVTPKTWFLKVLLGHRSDVFGFWIVIRLVGANNQGTSWTFAYDALGFLTRKTVPGTSAGQAATTWNYAVDTLGRTLRKQDPRPRLQRQIRRARPPGGSDGSRCDRKVPSGKPVQSLSSLKRMTTGTTCEPPRLGRSHYSLRFRRLRSTGGCLSARLPQAHPHGRRRLRESGQMMTNVAGQSTRYRYDVLNRSVGMTYSNGDTEIFGYDSRSNLIERESRRSGRFLRLR